MRAAQAATEYIVIAAVVLLVALVALSILSGNLGTDARKTASATAWRSAKPLSLIDFSKSGSVLTLVLFNNDAVPLTVTTISVDGTAITLPKPVKIESGSASKVYVPLPPSIAACTGQATSFSHRISFGFESEGMERTEDGPAELAGDCVSADVPEDACFHCTNEICCTPAICDLSSGNCTLSMCGNGIAEEGENCANCGGPTGDVHCASGQSCNAEGQCVSCIPSGHTGCSLPNAPCCGDITCNDGYCGDVGTCGDGICQPQNGETCSTCPLDCGVADGWCWRNETPETCPADCNNQNCGDHTCDPAHESCTSCPQDCGSCSACVAGGGDCSQPNMVCCGDNYCTASGTCTQCLAWGAECHHDPEPIGDASCCGFRGFEHQNPPSCVQTDFRNPPHSQCCIGALDSGCALPGGTCCSFTMNDNTQVSLACADNHCCIENGQPSSGHHEWCCSGVFYNGVEPYPCQGLPHCADCQFDAQCSSPEQCFSGKCRQASGQECPSNP